MELNVWLPGLALLCLTLLIAPPDAQAVQLTFTLQVLGLPVAESNMSFDLAPSSNGMGLGYRTTGVARLFAGDRPDPNLDGYFERDQPVPLEFRSNIRLYGQDRTVVLEYRNGQPHRGSDHSAQ